MGAISDYLRVVRAVHRGEPTEHSYRPALADLLQGLRAGVVATNEPKHRRDCGAPDMSVREGNGPEGLTIGYIECKDIGVSLDAVEGTDQLKRYRSSLDNLILTDYLQFRWYVEGTERARATLAHVDGDRIVAESAAEERVAELLGLFLANTPEPISSPRELARRMADLTGMIRDIIVQQFKRGDRSSQTRGLYEAFQETLLPNIEPGEFADMFAQTLAYGLFAARVNHPQAAPFNRYQASREIPRTNPFLRHLFETITGNALDDEPYVGFVDDLARVLAHADFNAILEDFGATTRQEDPIVHFYETFLAAYDPKVREMRGVYYTPQPVVSYIVRSVDWILREHFGLAGGLADEGTVKYTATLPDGRTEERTSPRVLILDPACGTGTFLYHVIEHIRNQFVGSNNAGKWPHFVANQLLPRLFGFELLMAPYAVAHLKLGMQLAAQDMTEAERARWTYDFEQDQRLGVYLTNTLEEAERTAQRQFGLMQTIADEANAASEVKRDMPIMVVLGNPPYSGTSANNGPWIDGLLKGELPDGTTVDSYYEVDGQPLGERNPKMLQDDYVKFIRWAQWRITQTGAGVVAFITNHGYLDNPTFRGMRESLVNSSSDVFILNLHGSSLKGETPPTGGVDRNVFDIRIGVAIVVLVRRPEQPGPARVQYAELWGTREEKYEYLRGHAVDSTEWGGSFIPPKGTYLLTRTDEDLSAEYAICACLPDALPEYIGGITTSRDSLVLAIDETELRRKMSELRAADVTDESISERYGVTSTSSWDLAAARKEFQASAEDPPVLVCMHRPFDNRWLCYHDALVGRPRRQVMRHMLRPNLALVTTRQTHDPFGCLATVTVSTHKSVAAYDRNFHFPLYVYPDPARLEGTGSVWAAGREGRRPNLTKEFVDQFRHRLGLRFVSDGRGDLEATFGPEDVFDYIYAVFHCPAYRERYSEFLKTDFPRVPLTSDVNLFRDLAAFGGELVQLHLLAQPALAEEADRISYPVPGSDTVDRAHPKYFAPGETAPGAPGPLRRGRVYINGTRDKKGATQPQYFEGIPPEVWRFQVGGYQVLDKWLKDRTDRKLSYEDIQHYQKVVIALERTIDLMQQIDARIEHWPIK